MHYHWEQTVAKKNKRGHSEQRRSSKKLCNFDSGQLEQQQGGLHSL